MNSTTDMFGYGIFNSSVGEAVGLVLKRACGGKSCFVACANPHSLVIAATDGQFAAALKDADLLLPDGIGIILAARILGRSIQGKIAGSDFFLALMKHLDVLGGKRVFFLGSSEQVLARIRDRVKRDFPHIQVCGTYSPPFKDCFSPTENEAMIRAVNAASPDLLWVGMTAPKQEKWIHANRHLLRASFVGAIGAVFDFYAGTQKRPADTWIRLGLEWLPRFLKEPRRLWKRNLKSTPIFLWWILKARIRQASVFNGR